MVVVKRRPSDPELITLARQLHRLYPSDSINIFDDDTKLKAYRDWTLNYPSKAYPYPEAWVNKHHVAMVNKMFDAGRGRWQLLGGSAHPERPDSKITDLE
jgi:hypothetical protein